MALGKAKLPRKYWVVSQNVNSIPRIVSDWEKVILSAKVAVMGYGPAKRGKRSKELGYKFAHHIKRGHIVLVARGTGAKRQLVGCGVVTSDRAVPGGANKSVRTLTGQRIRTPKQYGSYRQLFPFKPLNQGASVSFAGASSQRQAMYELHLNNAADKRICGWLRNKLNVAEYVAEPGSEEQNSQAGRKKATFTPPDTNDEPYFMMSPKQSRIARRQEAKLVRHFLAWAAKTKRWRIEGAMRYPVQFAEDNRAGQPCCDLYNADRNLLIEAKSKTDRHHILMAIGQLADYAHLHRTNGNPDPRRAVLLPKKPDRDLELLLNSVGIPAIWSSGRSFISNVNGVL